MKFSIPTLAWHCCSVVVVISQVGCSRSSFQAGNPQAQARAPILSRRAAADFAARLANDECERLHNKRPFAARQYEVVLESDRYRWGRLDPGGPKGLSAVVTFQIDGSQPNVQVYFSTDELTPMPDSPRDRSRP
jgi:hypothetical protein